MCPLFCYMSTLEQPAAETIVRLKRISMAAYFPWNKQELRLSCICLCWLVISVAVYNHGLIELRICVIPLGSQVLISTPNTITWMLSTVNANECACQALWESGILLDTMQPKLRKAGGFQKTGKPLSLNLVTLVFHCGTMIFLQYVEIFLISLTINQNNSIEA